MALPMKQQLLIFSRSLPFHGLGGMEIVAWELARAFAQSGHAVRTVTTSISGSGEEFDCDGVRVVALAGTPSGRYSSAWWRSSRYYLEQHRDREVYAVLSVSAAAFSAVTLRRRFPSVPFVLQVHGSFLSELATRLRSRRSRTILGAGRDFVRLPRDLLRYSQFDAVIAVGKRIHSDLTRPPVSWILPKTGVYTINNGIDTSVFRPSLANRRIVRERLRIDSNAPLIITASRLHSQKGVSHGLRAFAALSCEIPNAVYLVAGDGPERARLHAMSRHLGVTHRVRFLGALARPELAAALQASDVFLFPTERVEGLPLTVLEALACGLPCLVPPHLTLFASGSLRKADPRDSREVVHVLKEMIAGRAELPPAMLPEDFSLHTSAGRYLEIFDACRLSKGRNAPRSNPSSPR